MPRGKPLARTGRVKAVNAVRKPKLRTHQHGTDARTRWLREQPCVCKGKHPACTRGWSEPSHVVSRGAGGTAADIVPMSRGCHQAWHDHGQLSYFDHESMNRECRTCDAKGHFWWDGEDYSPPGEVVCPDCDSTGVDLIAALARLRHLARTHFATQGPDAPLPTEDQT